MNLHEWLNICPHIIIKSLGWCRKCSASSSLKNMPLKTKEKKQKIKKNWKELLLKEMIIMITKYLIKME